MNLFWKKLFGGLESTEKLEKKEEELMLAYKRYCDIQTSEQLKEYTQLFHLVKSADFKENKKTLQNRKFKDTEEYRDFRKYTKLANSAKVNLYYETIDSAQLKDFEAFKQTSDYEKLGKKNEVKNDERLKQYKSYERSHSYKNYLRLHGSFLIQEYEKLKDLVATEDFKQKKAYWEDKDRWLKTEDYKKEQRYYELQKTPEIAFYESVDPKKFIEMNSWALTFEDKFDGDLSKWKQGYFHRADALKKIYSFSNEKQAYTDGANTFIVNGNLVLATKEGKTEGLAWNPKQGFQKKTFDFSSAAINAGEFFNQRYGLVKAKLKIAGATSINYAFWLGADGKLPQINLFHYDGSHINVSSFAKTGNSVAIDKDTVKGISPLDYYIYSLEWTEKELIWKINNVVVKKQTSNIPSQSLFPAFSSFVSEAQAGGNGTMEVDWVRFYTKKK